MERGLRGALRGYVGRNTTGNARTGASGAKGDVGETSGVVTTVPPWSRQAGGEAVGGEEGVARVGVHGGRSDAEAQMAWGRRDGRRGASGNAPGQRPMAVGVPMGG